MGSAMLAPSLFAALGMQSDSGLVVPVPTNRVVPDDILCQ